MVYVPTGGSMAMQDWNRHGPALFGDYRCLLFGALLSVPFFLLLNSARWNLLLTNHGGFLFAFTLPWSSSSCFDWKFCIFGCCFFSFDRSSGCVAWDGFILIGLYVLSSVFHRWSRWGWWSRWSIVSCQLLGFDGGGDTYVLEVQSLPLVDCRLSVVGFWWRWWHLRARCAIFASDFPSGFLVGVWMVLWTEVSGLAVAFYCIGLFRPSDVNSFDLWALGLANVLKFKPLYQLPFYRYFNTTYLLYGNK